MIKNLVGGMFVAIMASSGAMAATVDRSADAIPTAKYVNSSAAKAVPSACKLSATNTKAMRKVRAGSWVSACGNAQLVQGGAAAAGAGAGSSAAGVSAATISIAAAGVGAAASVASLAVVASRSN